MAVERARALSTDAIEAEVSYDYWVTDGLYGSMNCLLYDHATIAPRPLILSGSRGKYPTTAKALGDEGVNQDESVGVFRSSTVSDPTCDGLDTTVVEKFMTAEIRVCHCR